MFVIGPRRQFAELVTFTAVSAPIAPVAFQRITLACEWNCNPSITAVAV
jgi:hypothetical protein